LVVNACLTPADGHAERMAALHMIEPRADRPQAITVGAIRTWAIATHSNSYRCRSFRRPAPENAAVAAAS
jgi:hypothetical protein